MLFNSPEFLLIFLPAAFITYRFSPPAFRYYVLIGFSFLFYALSGFIPFVFMVLSIAWVFIGVFIVKNAPKYVRVCVLVSFPLFTLFMFRYLGFALETTGTYEILSPYFRFFLGVLLPAGISFYTFQIIGYAIDVADGHQEIESNPLRMITFISFFPQLIAGPILRYDQIKDQLTRVTTEKIVDIDWKKAIKFLAVGLVAKVFIADIFAQSNDVYATLKQPSAFDSLFLVFSYSFRIYFDFWSYSLMAIGLAALFGLELPRNFREPYNSLNPKDFWRRWHVTLSYWLRDYVYIRLGGMKHYARNILIVFALVGLWHGAGWNFIVWGLYHACFVLLYASFASYWDRLYRPLQIGLTFLIVSLAWPLFFTDFSGYVSILSTIFDPALWTTTTFGLKKWFFLVAVGLLVFLVREDKWLFESQGIYRFINSPLLHSLMLFAGILGTTWSRTFIYFRF